MSKLVDMIHKFTSEFSVNRDKYNKRASTNNPLKKLLVDDIPTTIKETINMPDSYTVKGSIGEGLMAEIPWICFFDNEITKSARNGYYIVLLFTSDMKGLYFSLNQGWTQYKNHHKKDAKKAKKHIFLNSELFRKELNDLDNFEYTPIDLKANNQLGEGYEAGHICGYYFNIEELTEDIFVSSLNSLFASYSKLKETIGSDFGLIFATEADSRPNAQQQSKIKINPVAELSKLVGEGKIGSLKLEEDYQNESQQAQYIRNLPNGGIPKDNNHKQATKKSWVRNSEIAHIVLINENHKCMVSGSHETFTSYSSGKQFVEAHHIIPMKAQDDFEYSLDVPENIASLCPTCHAKIHHGKFDDIEETLKNLYYTRQEGLKERMIQITYEDLCNYYNK